MPKKLFLLTPSFLLIGNIGDSSGYVYNARTKTLFLKYRHKSETEIVRLIYKDEPPKEETIETTEETTEGVVTSEAAPSTPTSIVTSSSETSSN